jgi:hypothetical protein
MSFLTKRKPKEQHALVKKIVDKTFSKEVNTNRAQEIKNDLINYFYSNYGGDKVSGSVNVTDMETFHWMKDEHFVKIFNHEIKHAQEYYSLSNAERLFILDISDYLMWEMNILVDEEDKPLNQKRLAEKLGITPKSVRDKMLPLNDKNIVHTVELVNEVFYIINPYIVYRGKDINSSLPELFDELGYVNSKMIDKSSRSHRKNEQKKRLKV